MSDQKPAAAVRSVYLIAALSVLLGLAFNYLFFEKLIGVSLPVFVIAAMTLTIWLCGRFGYSYRPALWLMGLAAFFSLAVMVRDSGFLAFLNVITTLGLLLLAIRVLAGGKVADFRLPDYARTIVILPFKILRRCLEALSLLLSPAKNSSPRRTQIIKGVLMALPFLIIFGILFASADLAFKQFFASLFAFDIPDTFFAHGLFILAAFAVSLGVWAYMFNLGTKERAAPVLPDNSGIPAADRSLETKIFLWLIAALFLVFIVFQVSYLFGGAALISNSGFTYAEYARRGFWELLAVGFVTLLILLAMDFYTKGNASRGRWFTLPSLVMSAEIFIIIVSAFKRLMLYQDAYGLTTLRLYVAAFIIFLALVFIILAIKLWRDKKDSFFAFGVLLSMIAFMACFNFINPDNFIARINIARFERGGSLDAAYLSFASADAVPAVLGVYARLPENDKGLVRAGLIGKMQRLQQRSGDWQSFNLSRQRALRLLEEGFNKNKLR